MGEERSWGPESYWCATCNERVEGDLLVYLGHTDRHIIEAIKEMNPGWVEADGACPK